MSYLTEWNAIAAHIRSLSAAAQLHAAFLNIRESDSYGRSTYLADLCREALTSIEGFVARYRSTLPSEAVTAIDQFIAARRTLFHEAVAAADVRQERSRAAIVLLATLESRISFLLSDLQAAILARSELAFAHLQRSIAADPDFRRKWITAFDAGEVACEKLGAAHLFSHGIWAFKAAAAGAITDLIFQDTAVTEAPTVASGLVLTEWKKATGSHVQDSFSAAQRQAKLYSPGALSGNELTTYRYLVVVTDAQSTRAPEDVQVGGVRYRHILLSINPASPLVQSAGDRRKSDF